MMTYSTPTDIDHELDEIETAVVQGDRSLALKLATSALQRGIDEPLVLLLVAERLEGEGEGQQALALLKKATLITPDEAEVWKRLGGALARQGMFANALEAFDAALVIDPGSYPTLVVAGAASFKLGDLKAAERYYRRAADLTPNEPELLSTLAVIAARQEDTGEARALGERVLAVHPNSINAHMAIARSDLLDGHADVAVQRMNALLARTDLNDENRIATFDLRADALDKRDRPADAFADYVSRNTLLARINAPIVKRELNERRIDQARRLAAFFAATPAEPWRNGAHTGAQSKPDVQKHIFLLGFPRSGTTLLEKALASHPDIVTLEEVDHLGDAGNHLLESNAALNDLANLTTTAADACRETYWRGVHKTFGRDISGQILVDKMPLHTPALPVIAKLFPDAKILFALRDPRDVVLSCFRRRFRMNSAMYEFLTLDGAAQYYDQVMTLAEIYRGLLPLDIHEVRHEALVANFEGDVSSVLAFMGAKWDPAVKGFATRARTRLRTPSDPQVARGLNSDGLGQWRRYEAQLAPVMGILERWVSRFKYRANDSLTLPP